LVVLTLTPRGDGTPTAVSATTTPLLSGIAPVALTIPGAESVDPSSTAVAAATLVGERGLAVVTARAVVASARSDSGATGAVILVRLESGRTTAAAVVENHLDLTVVSIVDQAHAGPGDHEMTVARELPELDDVVTLLTDPPVTMEFDDIGRMDVDEGTAVVDAKGDLVGLCSDQRRGDGASEFIPIAGTLDVAIEPED
jgi:hypothetical protein